MARTFTCVAEDHGDGWEAICLDFDIAVQGDTFEDVRRMLEEAVHSYLAIVRMEDAATQKRLMRRSVPLSLRLSYAARIFWQSIWNARQTAFNVPCHA